MFYSCCYHRTSSSPLTQVNDVWRKGKKRKKRNCEEKFCKIKEYSLLYCCFSKSVQNGVYKILYTESKVKEDHLYSCHNEMITFFPRKKKKKK